MSDDLKHYSHVNASLKLIGLAVGQTGQRSSKRYIFQKYVSLPGTIVLVLLILYNLRYASDIYDFTKDFEALSTFGHVRHFVISFTLYFLFLDRRKKNLIAELCATSGPNLQ